MDVLVAYATAHGSTRGVAERIAAQLEDHVDKVDCLPIDWVQSIDAYDAVVVGSAIHGQQWLPEAERFMKDNAERLATKQVWLFSVGMPGALGRPLRKWAMREGPKVLADFHDPVHPVGEQLFSGVVKREQFGVVSRAIFHLMGGRLGDYRDWPAIERWGASIADALALPAAS